MQTAYQIALDEFREASAAVRRAFGAVSEARELQILANSQHATASTALLDAQARLEKADSALMRAREAQVYAPVNGSGPVTQAEIDAIEPNPAAPSAVIEADPAELGVG